MPHTGHTNQEEAETKDKERGTNNNFVDVVESAVERV
jgi:hypothetical protein